MVGWHHRLNGHECEQVLGVADGQGGLACCSPWGRKESDMTEQLNSTTFKAAHVYLIKKHTLVINVFTEFFESVFPFHQFLTLL